MKTLNTSIQQPGQARALPAATVIPGMLASARDLMALTIAMILAIVVAGFFVELASIELTDLQHAGVWGMGLVFFGLAVESRDPQAGLFVLTGVALTVLSWLQATVSVDFITLSGFIVAGWTAVGVFQRLR